MYPYIQQVLADWRHYLTEDFSDEEREQLDSLLERVLEKAAAYADKRLAKEKEPLEGGEKG